MISIFSTTYKKEDIIEFVIDDSGDMSWISGFDSRKFDRFFVVIDREVSKLWKDIIQKNLNMHKKETIFFEVEAVEKSKSLDFYPKLVNFLEGKRCNLGDLVIAVGGGIIIDLVSFTCSTYMRALSFYAIPTTLIGQIDASTAGKTCLNTKSSKNLLGTFYYPLKVYNNINFLKTNNRRHLRQGYSEIFKYGLLRSKKLIEMLKEHIINPSSKLLIDVIKLAIEVRIQIRKKDPLASNLGHTFGHAIEKLSRYEILHGDAISSGIVLSLYFSKNEGLIGEKEAEEIVSIMKSLGLNIYIEKNTDATEFVNAMMRDKKSSMDSVNLVLLRGIEKPYEHNGYPFYKTTPDKIRTFLESFMKKYDYAIDDCSGLLKKEEILYS